jgi:hypothetical protein
MPGKSTSLYQYLENRYANTVILTFAQIEDGLGFTLPGSARVHQEWWANKDPNDTPQPHSRSLDFGQQDSHAEPAGPDRCF